MSDMYVIPFLSSNYTHDELEEIVNNNVGISDWCFSYPDKLLKITTEKDLSEGCQAIADLYGDGTFTLWENV